MGGSVDSEYLSVFPHGQPSDSPLYQLTEFMKISDSPALLEQLLHLEQ